MGILIKGKTVADVLKGKLKTEVEQLKIKGACPKLAIIRVGANPDDLAYERGILKTMEFIGIRTQVNALPKNTNQKVFVNVLEEANTDSSVHGILIFRPLPSHLNSNIVKKVIAPEKDVDCFGYYNVAKVMEGDETGFAPCTPNAVMEILRHYEVDLRGKNAVVVGRSMVVGKPVSMLLLQENATVTICHSKTDDLKGIASKADVLVAGVGKAKMITPEYVKGGAVVIDVGINVDEHGRLSGDVDTDGCIHKASMITSVPGGVGSVTTSILAKHVVKACKIQI